MTNAIARTRAVAHLEDIASRMAPNLPQGEYAEGYLDGYRAAAAAVGRMMSDRDAALIADLNAEVTQ